MTDPIAFKTSKASSVCTVDHHHVLSFHSMNIEPSFALVEPLILYAPVCNLCA